MQDNLEVGTFSEGHTRSSWEVNDNEPLKMHGNTKYIYIYTAPNIRNKYSEKWYWMASFPISAFLYLCERLYIPTFLLYCFFAIVGIYTSHGNI